VTAVILLFLAQFSTVPAPRQALAAATADVPVSLTLRLADGRRQFRPGEVVPIELEFSSAIPTRFVVDDATYDRSGRLTIDDFRIEPIERVTDPMLDYFASRVGSIGGGLRGTGILGDRPFIVRLELNDWFRFDRTGTFQLSVRSRRVTDNAAKSDRLVVPVESNTISFEVAPRDAAWEARALAAARRLLDEAEATVDRRQGCRMLRFLGTEGAIDEMIHRYGTRIEDGCDFEYAAGLFGAPDREYVVKQMESRLAAPDQQVTASYLRTLGILSVYLQHPEFRPLPTRELKGTLNSGGEMSRHADLIDAASAWYAEVISAALPEKTGQARAITLAERLGNEFAASAGAARAVSREQLAGNFLQLPAERQEGLLGSQWSSVASPAMIPALRQLAERSITASASVSDLALRRFADLAPEEARSVILREIGNPPEGASLKTLGRLPDDELPELDEILAANLDATGDLEARGDFNAAGIRAELVHRYASKKNASRVLQSVSGRLTRLACRTQAAVLAYFLRVDDNGTGVTLLDRALTARASSGACRTSLGLIADLRMTPIVEARAVANLDGNDPGLVIDAIETLGRHGSPASLAPLRAGFERWHAAWDSRAIDLQYRPGTDKAFARQGMVEDAFRQALGAGAAWLTSSSELRVLAELCVTDNCRTHTRLMIDAADDARITIVQVNEPGDSLITIGQYQLRSMQAFEQKLAQYPRGTSFTVDVAALDDRTATIVLSDVRRFADAHGIGVTTLR
jgi:hypothetical protein